MPTASRKRAIRRRWLQPSSSARPPTGARPPLAPRRASDQATPGSARGAAARRAWIASSTMAKARSGVPAQSIRSASSAAAGPMTSPRSTERLASSPIGTPSRRRAASGARSTCRQRAVPACETITGPSVRPATNDPSRSGAALGAAAVGDRPAGVEVDDHRHVGAGQLAEGDRPGRALGVPGQADDRAGQRGPGRARDELRAHLAHARPATRAGARRRAEPLNEEVGPGSCQLAKPRIGRRGAAGAGARPGPESQRARKRPAVRTGSKAARPAEGGAAGCRRARPGPGGASQRARKRPAVRIWPR